MEFAQQGHDLRAGVAVEVAGRLVGEDERRLGDERPSDRDSLLLAAARAPRFVVDPVAEAQALERGLRPSSALGHDRPPWYSSGVATLSSAVVRGSRLYDWKTNPIVRLRSPARPSSSSVSTGVPASS